MQLSGNNVFNEDEELSSTKDSDRNSLSSLNDQIYNKFFSGDHRMSVVSLMSCKESVQLGAKIPFLLNLLIQGLETSDVEKLRK